jgi:dynactin 6
MAEPASKRASTTGRTTKRTSVLPSAPKAPTTLDPTAVIADKATLTGAFPIIVHARAVINPYSKITSAAGPVEIGEGAIVWEKAVVGFSTATEGAEQHVKLGPNVVVETGAVVEGVEVGDCTVIESFARVGAGAKIGKVCFDGRD